MKSYELTEDNLCKGILRFAIPLVLSNFVQQLYNTVDAVILGNFVGDMALGAVGITNYAIIFTLVIFVGMATGMLFAQLFALWLPGSETAILLGLAGMATLLAATTHAPIMSALMVCEMTGQYFLLPGLLVACVLASVLSRTLRHDSIYGQHATEGREIDVLR